MYEIDHIVFGALSLEEGTEFIEKKLNVKLIERTTRSLNLTYDGKIFLERARKRGGSGNLNNTYK